MASLRNPLIIPLIVLLILANQPVAKAVQNSAENPPTFASTILDRFGNNAAAGEQCRAVTLVVARGSEQNDHVEPQLYSDRAARMSNGYEG